jgi:hypothetical protein
MWVVVHLMSGLALGALFPDTWSERPVWLLVTVPAALSFHALLDLVPHWDYTRHRLRGLWGGLDVLVTLGSFLVAAFGLGFPGLVLLTGAVSALPDLDVLDSLLPFERRARWFPSHWRRYPHGSCGPLPGVLTQAAVVGVSVAVLAFAA